MGLGRRAWGLRGYPTWDSEAKSLSLSHFLSQGPIAVAGDESLQTLEPYRIHSTCARYRLCIGGAPRFPCVWDGYLVARVQVPAPDQ